MIEAGTDRVCPDVSTTTLKGLIKPGLVAFSRPPGKTGWHPLILTDAGRARRSGS